MAANPPIQAPLEGRPSSAQLFLEDLVLIFNEQRLFPDCLLGSKNQEPKSSMSDLHRLLERSLGLVKSFIC